MRRTTALALAASLFLAPIVRADNLSVAQEHFGKGEVLYEATRYEAALREFEAAQSLQPSPALIYDIARCLERLGRRAEALAAYERYLAEAVKPSNGAEVRARVAELAAPPLPAPQPPAIDVARAVPPSPRSQHRRWLVPGVVGGAALALAATGAGLLGSAAAGYRSLESGCAPTCAPSSWAGLPARERAGEALLGIAGAAVVADVVLFVIEAKRRK